jgi:EF hand
MKTTKIMPQMAYAISPNQIAVINLQTYKSFFPPIGLAFAICISLSLVTSPVRAETTGTEDIQHYMNSQSVEKTAGRAGQNTKKSPATTDVVAKKTNQDEHATNSSTVGTDGKPKQVAKETTTEKCAGAKNAASKAQAPTPDSQSTNTDQNVQQTTLAKDIKPEKSPSGDKTSQVDRKIEPVSKPADGKGKLPTFAQADVNGDHNITKDELQNFPYLLQVFDKVDASHDGKLEQHEYQNLEMETKREGEVK